MRFALIGDHPDGLALALAFRETGRHELARYAGPIAGADRLSARGLAPAVNSDVDELLADPTVELVIVADDLEHRAEVLRRAVRAEKHVLCVHPADVLPDITYEASLVQQETRRVLLPILPARFNPGLIRLRGLLATGTLGRMQSLEGEFPLPPPEDSAAGPRSPAAKQRSKHRPAGNWDQSPLVTLWEPLRFLAGEVREVSAVGVEGEVLRPSDPLTLTGRFQDGSLFQVLLVHGQAAPRSKLSIRGTQGEAVLTIGHGGHQETELRWWAAPSPPTPLPQGERGDSGPPTPLPQGERGEARWDWNPWPAVVANFEGFLAGQPSPVSWLDGTRCLELFEAARQSVRRKRLIPIQFEEFSETGSFKTAMTALGCLVLVLVPVIVVLLLAAGAPLGPWSLYFLLPLLALFLLLQALGWIVLRERTGKSG